jgi:hypothetical protein
MPIVCFCNFFGKRIGAQKLLVGEILRAAFFIEFCGAYMCLQFVFVIFWQKEIETKSVNKIFVQFLQISGQLRLLHGHVPQHSGVNFINIYVHVFCTKFRRQSRNITRKAAK